jgi:RNA polymerase sigma-70 factor, ECF subfamily
VPVSDHQLSQLQFQKVIVPHLAAARALARSLIRNRADSDDIVQEACLRAYRALDRFRGASPRAWILTIVRNTAYDWMRRHRRDPDAVGEFTGLESLYGLCDHETPETLLLRDHEAIEVRRVIGSLPQVFGQALLMRYESGLTHREIADRTGVPAGTVMSRLCRARRRLAADLLM